MHWNGSATRFGSSAGALGVHRRALPHPTTLAGGCATRRRGLPYRQLPPPPRRCRFRRRCRSAPDNRSTSSISLSRCRPDFSAPATAMPKGGAQSHRPRAHPRYPDRREGWRGRAERHGDMASAARSRRPDPLRRARRAPQTADQRVRLSIPRSRRPRPRARASRAGSAAGAPIWWAERRTWCAGEAAHRGEAGPAVGPGRLAVPARSGPAVSSVRPDRAFAVLVHGDSDSPVMR